MQQPETPNDMPPLNKVRTEDLHQWKTMFSTPPFLFFQLMLEKLRKDIANTMMSPGAMKKAVEDGRTFEFYQGKNAMINEIQAFFKEIDNELSARKHSSTTVADANNERQRRRIQQQNR